MDRGTPELLAIEASTWAVSIGSPGRGSSIGLLGGGKERFIVRAHRRVDEEETMLITAMIGEPKDQLGADRAFPRFPVDSVPDDSFPSSSKSPSRVTR